MVLFRGCVVGDSGGQCRMVLIWGCDCDHILNHRGGMHGFIWGGMCGFIQGEHVWSLFGGMHGYYVTGGTRRGTTFQPHLSIQ